MTLSKTVAGFSPNPVYTYNLNVVGYYDPTQAPFDNTKRYTYHELIRYCRYFFETDTIARTVINRMVDMSITELQNEFLSEMDQSVQLYYTAVAKKLQPYLEMVALEYLVNGLAVPEVVYTTTMLNRLDRSLGRKRVEIPSSVWVRNPSNLRLKRRPAGMERAVYLEIPPEDVTFIEQKGKRPDGTDDVEAYKELVRMYPDYVKAVLKGQRVFLLPTAFPIYGDLLSHADYPIPFLKNALKAMQHKEYLKLMDQTIVARSIELVRQVKVGSDTFPATDDDLATTKMALAEAAASGDRVFNLFTNHTVDIRWILPPLDALLSDVKYVEPNAEIFLALGFPRVLTVGESLRSNSSDSRIASLGPLSRLNRMREKIIRWVEHVYQDLAERNGFADWPKPVFSPIQFQDMTALTQFAIQAQQAGAISKDVIAQMYGTTYQKELEKIQQESANDQQESPAPEEPSAETESGVPPSSE
jgi:hypothetical protein